MGCSRADARAGPLDRVAPMWANRLATHSLTLRRTVVCSAGFGGRRSLWTGRQLTQDWTGCGDECVLAARPVAWWLPGGRAAVAAWVGRGKRLLMMMMMLAWRRELMAAHRRARLEGGGG